MPSLTRLECLYDEAVNSHIEIIDHHYSDTKKGACLYDENYYKVIALDKPAIESVDEECTVLAEELAHYDTGSLYFLDATYNMPIYRSNVI